MKKIIVLALITAILSGSMTGGKITQGEIEDLVHIMKNNNLKIDEWQITIKEKVERDKKQDIINNIKENGNYTRKERKNSVLYTFEDSHIYSESVETYNVLISKNKSDDIEIIAEFKGYTWNKKLNTNYEKWLRKMNDIFTPSARIYTCLTTEFNGIINADYVLNDISKELEIKHEQTQIDNHEKSTLDKIIYGYTPLWSQKINIMNNPTNVQIAVTSNEKGMVKFTVGTPILINEY